MLIRTLHARSNLRTIAYGDLLISINISLDKQEYGFYLHEGPEPG
jgi:hypothetical protein